LQQSIFSTLQYNNFYTKIYKIENNAQPGWEPEEKDLPADSADDQQSNDATTTEEDENVLEDEDAAEGNMNNGELGDAKDDLYTSVQRLVCRKLSPSWVIKFKPCLLF